MIGETLSHYRITAKLGAGGMGEVWRARDTRLNREVAIKVLPASFANDEDRLRRFEQEARTTSALNHPNILTVYDIGNHEGSPFIVTELLEGEELRAELNAGAIASRRATDYAQQIAGGLAAAHSKAVVHRDLKPENIFITTDGRVKILDFGLAKLKPVKPASGAGSQADTQKAITDPGTVMGTVGYMSPEQVRGQEADHRSDVFSFGVILYEMLSGRRAFHGESGAETMAAIVKEEPPEFTETDRVSAPLERIMRRCLEKKPELRFQSSQDLAFALEALSIPSAATEAVRARSTSIGREKWWIAATALAVLVALGMSWAYFTRKRQADAPLMKLSLLPPENSSFGQIAVSPDGRLLVFTAATGGKLQLWVRPLDAIEAKALAGTQGATFPFWSPDSRFIGFFADGRLKKIEASGGLVQTLCDVPIAWGGAWSRDGAILFASGVGGGLFRISAGGGEVTQVTINDRARQEANHALPAFLPDGRHFLYAIRSGLKETRGTYLGSLDGTVKQRLLGDFTASRYTAAVSGDTASGGSWLLFGRDDALLAQPFDARRLQFTGEPFPLAERVGSDPVLTGQLTFSVSDNGVLVFDPSAGRQRRQYLWKDRRTQQTSLLEVPGSFGQPWLSPDEKRFIADRTDPLTGTYDLWLCDVSGGNATRFTFDPANDISPVWSPDGSRIVWSSSREGGVPNLYQKAASLAGEDTPLLKSDYTKFATDWSRDGRFIFYYQTDPKTKWDVWVLPVAGSDGQPSGEAKPSPVLHSEANEIGATLSPDGRWLAYASDESGRYEVYVQSFPEGGGKRQVSTSGGLSPRWRRDGHELFYYAADGKMIAAPVRSGASFELGVAVSLFEFRAGNVMTSTRAPYAVTADGQRFLINAVVETEPYAPLTVVVNWTANAKR